MRDDTLYKYYFMCRGLSFDEFYLLEHTATLANKMSGFVIFCVYKSSNIGKFYISLN